MADLRRCVSPGLTGPPLSPAPAFKCTFDPKATVAREAADGDGCDKDFQIPVDYVATGDDIKHHADATEVGATGEDFVSSDDGLGTASQGTDGEVEESAMVPAGDILAELFGDDGGDLLPEHWDKQSRDDRSEDDEVQPQQSGDEPLGDGQADPVNADQEVPEQSWDEPLGNGELDPVHADQELPEQSGDEPLGDSRMQIVLTRRCLWNKGQEY